MPSGSPHSATASTRPSRVGIRCSMCSGMGVRVATFWVIDRDASPIAAYHPAVSATSDPRVDDYIDGLPGWQQAICRRVRELVHEADPEIVETIKRTRQPYFVLDGNVCALLATRDHVNVFLYDGGIVPDPHGIVTGGHDNKTGRTVAIYEGRPVNAAALQQVFVAIIADNRAGGWRKLKKT